MTTTAVAAAQGVGDIVLSGPLIVALLIAVAAGAVSFFSPRCLPLVPRLPVLRRRARRIGDHSAAVRCLPHP